MAIESSDLRSRALTLLACVGVVWAVSLYALWVDPGFVYDLAVIPRRADSLLGIFGMPFVHGSLGHLLANTWPLVVFGGILLSRGTGYFLLVTLAIAVLAGLVLWLFGRGQAHIGASGVICGYFGFVVVRGLYERRIPSLAIASIAVFLYGGSMLFGLVPQEGVSWEGHLCGLIAGMGVARFAFGMDRRRERQAAQAET